MEGRLNASTSGSEVQEEKSDGSIVHQEGKRGGTRGQFGQFCEESTSKASSPSLKSSGTRKEEDELQTGKAEMGEVREENERLRVMLKQIEKDYKSLQMRIVDIMQHETQKKNSSNNNNNNKPSITDHGDEVEEEPEQLVSLCLGRSPSEPKRDRHDNTTKQLQRKDQDEQLKEGLKLGLDCNPEGYWSKSEDTSDQISPGNSAVAEITKEEQAGETWPPSKALKTMRSSGDDQDELSQQQPTVKRARVSVRARCDTPTMNDGCQWRKYGQKIAKGNPCPRAYYRCTVAPACPVRKQVQRCAEDMSILITTYEGTHNHPLPISATAMASTTSAAASMLLSGSSTSSPSATATASPMLMNNLPGGLNLNLSDNPSRSSIRPFYLANTSSTSQAAFPTITLDLTSSSGRSTQFNMFSSSSRFPPTTLGFSSSESNNTLPATWGNGYLNYTSLPYSKTSNTTSGSINLGRPSQDQYFYHQPHNNNQASNSQQILTETLTKAIASDPNFRSVIAAAISSVVGDNGGKESLAGQTSTLKWGDLETINQTFNSNPVTQNGKGCGSSYLNRSNSSLNSQSGSLMFLQQRPPLPFSLSKNTSMPAAADSNRDEIN